VLATTATTARLETRASRLLRLAIGGTICPVLGAFTDQAHNLILLAEDEARMLGASTLRSLGTWSMRLTSTVAPSTARYGNGRATKARLGTQRRA